MSYILKIWEPAAGDPPMRDLTAVLAAVADLQEGRAAPARRFGPFLEALTRRHPDITSPEAEELPESEWAWSDGPLLPGRSAVLVLGLRSENVDRVRPFVIEQAMQSGLAVLDAQAAEAYLPGVGRLGGRISADAARRPAVDLPSAGEVGTAVADALDPMLGIIGFKRAKSRPTFKRSFPGGRQLVELIIDDNGTAGIEFNILCTFYFDKLAELLIPVSLPHLHPSVAKDLPTMVLRQEKWIAATESFVDPRSRNYVVRTRPELARALSHLAAQWEQRVQPILQQATTLEGADRLLNTQPLTASPFFHGFRGMYVNVLLVYLTRNSRVQEIGESILAEALEKPQRERVGSCMAYVRAHPLP